MFLFKTRSNKEKEDLYDYYGALRYTKEQFFQVFKYATEQPYSFLMIKLEGADAPQYYRCFEENITNKFFSPGNNIDTDEEDECSE